MFDSNGQCILSLPVFRSNTNTEHMKSEDAILVDTSWYWISSKCNYLALICSSNLQSKYAVDEMTKVPGHYIVYIPPHHFELYPITLWGSLVKGYIKEPNTKFTLTAVEEFTWRILEEKMCWVEKMLNMLNIKIFWEADNLKDQWIAKFCIWVWSDESDEWSRSETDANRTKCWSPSLISTH